MKTHTRHATAIRRSNGEVILSTERPCDQDGLILSADGWDLSRAAKVPVKLFFNHATHGPNDFPIGRWEGVRISGGELRGRPVFADKEDPARAGVIAKLWNGGFLDDVSVSFSVDQSRLSGPQRQPDGKTYQVSGRHVLIEASVVGIGADQGAGKGRLEEAVARGIVTRSEAQRFESALSHDWQSAQLPVSREQLRGMVRAAIVKELAVKIASVVKRVDNMMRGRLPD